MIAKIKLIIYPIVIFFVWRIIILLFQIFIQPEFMVSQESATLDQRLFLSWVIYWDGGHYVGIAENGYKFPQQAFFPLLPLVINFFSRFLIPVFTAAFILTIVLGLITFIIFYLLAKDLTNEKNARLALLFLAAFPGSIFLHAVYSEALFLPLTLTSFYLLERKKYFYSALFAGLSSGTRLIGALTSIPFLFTKKSIKERFLYIVISLSGLFLYMAYLKNTYFNPLLFIDAQKSWCVSHGRCGIGNPLKPVMDYTGIFLQGWIKPSLSSSFVDYIATIIALLLLACVFRRFKISYFLYTLLIILIPLSSGSMIGMIRFILVGFPLFFIIPLIIKWRPLYFLILILLLALQLRFVTFFTNRIWVA